MYVRISFSLRSNIFIHRLPQTTTTLVRNERPSDSVFKILLSVVIGQILRAYSSTK